MVQLYQNFIYDSINLLLLRPVLMCNNSGFVFFFKNEKEKRQLVKLTDPCVRSQVLVFFSSSSSSSDPPTTWTQAHHTTQWQSWRIHNTQSIENIVLIIWCHIKGLVHLISFIYFFLKLIYYRCISLTNWSWFAIPTFQFRQVESCRKSRNFRQVSKKKVVGIEVVGIFTFFRRYTHIRVGDPAQSRNFQKNKTGIAAHKVWSNSLLKKWWNRIQIKCNLHQDHDLP